MHHPHRRAAARQIGLALAASLSLPAALAAAFGAGPVQTPHLSYTGRSEPANIAPVTTQQLTYTGRLSPALPAVTTAQLAYQGKGDPKGIAAVATPALTYKGKQ